MGRRFESCQARQPGDPSRPVAAIAVGLIAGAVLVYGVLLRNSVPFGPGPDPFDYVQSAARLAAGRSLAVPIDEPAALGVASAHAVFFVPEPFVPLPGGTHYGPLYPPGTALLMVPLVALLGVERGPYLLSPLLAAAGILVFYGIARTWLGRTHSLLAAGLLALSPVFLLPAKAPLSDVPARVAPLRGRLQTAVLAVPGPRRFGLEMSLASLGVTRITRLGRAQEPSLAAPHDGHSRLADLVQWTTVEE